MSHPIESIIPSGHGPVLEVLAHTHKRITGRTVARLLAGRLSQRRVADVLRELTAAGLVLVEPAGAAMLYELNRDHLAAPAIVTLAELRTTLIDQLRAEIAAWDLPPEAAWLFGSMSREQGRVDSDIDVCMLRSDRVAEDDQRWIQQVTLLQSLVLGWTGNGLEILEYSDRDFRALVKKRDPIVTNLLNDALVLSGATVATYLGRA